MSITNILPFEPQYIQQLRKLILKELYTFVVQLRHKLESNKFSNTSDLNQKKSFHKKIKWIIISLRCQISKYLTARK